VRHAHHHPYRWHARRNPVGWYLRMRLHRRIFVWFGASILLTSAVAVGLASFGTEHHWPFWIPLCIAVTVLWAASGQIARRLTRPLGELTRVTHEIGVGNLKARAHVNPWYDGEAGVLGQAINEMAERIERQMADQRELLAAVSHELRTPLGRIRILAELARTRPGDAKVVDDLDREVVEIDALVGDLLAKSRIDFSAVARQRLQGGAVAERALERAGVSAEHLAAEPGDLSLDGDPTLLARALANLLQNAQRHGGGVVQLRVRRLGDAIAFEVEDAGPGFPAGEQDRAFQAFHSRPPAGGKEAGGLGLGLSLVARIAEVHGGRAYAENRPEGGARVGFQVSAAAASR